MRALRVVGITEGGGEISVVLEDPARRERFTVPADEQLRAAARGDLTRLGQISIELESQLRPREIQARIRAGASVEQVAAAAGVPLQKIERFAYPVLLERSRTAEVAQRAHPVRADGPDSRTLGDVVAHTFGLRGQEYAEAEWDSWKGEDGKWIVALSWRTGHSDNRAHWTFQPGAHGGTVTAVDEHASDLVEGLPSRPLRTVGPVIDMARPEEPTPTPTQNDELRAAASDTVRARVDTREHPGPPDGRTPNRTAPEPRRPMPPAQPAAEYQRADGPYRQAPQRGGQPPATRDGAPMPTRPQQRRPEQPQPEGDDTRTEPIPTTDASAGPPRQHPQERPVDPTPPPQERAAAATPEPAAVDEPRTEPTSRSETPAEPERVRPDPAAAARLAAQARAAAKAAPAGQAKPAATAEQTGTAEPAGTARPRSAPSEPARSKAAPDRSKTAKPAEPADEPASEQTAEPETAVAAEAQPEEKQQPGATKQATEEKANEKDAKEPEQPKPTKRTKKGKPVMPSWDEVLLGVRGQR